MITVLSLNPCLDKTLRLDRFSLDAPNRVELERVDLGGKGVNVARVLGIFPEKPRLFGFDYQGSPVEKEMAMIAECHLFPLSGDLRVNLKIRQQEGPVIEVNERGVPVNESILSGMEEALLSICQPGEWIALCGSLPPGAPIDTYARLCRRLKEKGCLVAVDCDGPALRAALEEGPHLIKPNAQEFFALTGISPDDEKAALQACRELHNRGVGMICLSRGPEGALLSAGTSAISCPAADVPVLGVQGAGDSMLAGFLYALAKGDGLENALRFASAVAGGSVMKPGTQLCAWQDALDLYAKMPPCDCCS